MNKELALLQALWKKAATMDKPLHIPCKTEAAAKRLRFQLYNALKKVKNAPHTDMELYEAGNKCSISWKEDDRTVLLLGELDAPESLKNFAASLGIDVESAKPAPTEEEFRVNESLKKLQDKLAGVAAAPQEVVELPVLANPYASAKRER